MTSSDMPLGSSAMTSNAPAVAGLVLDAEQLRQLDAQYVPFPDLAAWPGRNDVDLSSWDRARTLLTERKSAASERALATSVRLAMRAAAADTGAIEHLYAPDRGFTVSVATELAAWEAGLAKKPADVRALLEAQLAAYELAMDAATEALPISQVLIRRLHEELAAPQKTYKVLVPLGGELVEQERPLPKGEYKTNPNHVRTASGGYHAYAPVGMTAPEMERLVAQLQLPEFQAAHPVLQSSYAHHALTAVHPFADGNGRAARAFASIFLYRAVSVPLVVFVEQEDEYLDALAAADGGRPQAFVKFILERATDTMSLIADQLSPAPEDQLNRLRNVLMVGRSSTTYDELADLGLAVSKKVLDEFTAQINALTVPRGVSTHVQEFQGHQPANLAGYSRNMKHPHGGMVMLSSNAPNAVAQSEFRVILGGADEPQPLAIEADLDGEDRRYLQLRLSEVQPDLSSGAKIRLAAWVRGILGEMTARLTKKVSESIGRSVP